MEWKRRQPRSRIRYRGSHIRRYRHVYVRFEQNLPVPTLTHSDVFYSRQLWVYNFGIHDCVSKRGCMYMWSELTAKRGSSEVASCLLKCFSSLKTRATSLVLYLDGCAGQNKNKVILFFLLSLIHQKIYQRIDHKFLTRGHTFLPNDRDFAIIEKRKCVEQAFVPEDWIRTLKSATLQSCFCLPRWRDRTSSTTSLLLCQPLRQP